MWGILRHQARALSAGRTLAGAATGALAFMALMPVTGTAAGTNSSSPVVAGSERVAGLSYGQLQEAAWRWRLALPAVTPATHTCLTARQHGPVWFLSSSATPYPSPPETVTCSVPQGEFIAIFTPSIDCSTVEHSPFHAATDAGLVRCARALWRRNTGFMDLTLDGTKLEPAYYEGATRAFGFTMPAHNNWLEAPSRTKGRVAVYGAESILRPLNPGVHTLVKAGWYAKDKHSTEITYEIIVR
jgi:hypothetical protein